MGGPDDKDETLSPPSEATTELDPSAPGLRPLTERYDLLGELGRGGMGAVYKARDRETGDIVALKVLLPEIAARPELIERFKAELLLARKITHKNVCRVYDLNRFGSVAAISMEYIEGESLRALLKRPQGLSTRYALNVLRQVLAGLGEAHARGVVHRDLKPENILIATDGTVKVMDFGIARSLETGATKTGTLIGTPAYMSPEQVEGKPADARSDLYSLGLMMYEMFTGRLAFQADTPVALAMKRLQEPPPPPRTVEPDLPERLDRVIQKCLERNPKKRFQSVAALEAALTERVPARPTVAEAEVPLPLHLTRWQRSDWLLFPLAAAGLLLFFSFFEGTSLAPRSPVAFDRGALPRIAQEYAQRVGAPVGKDYRMGAMPLVDRYEYLATTAGARAALELANNPVPYWEWYVAWHHPDRRPTEIWVDNRGSLINFNRGFPAGSGTERLSPEEAKPLAEKALADFFNRNPSELRLESAANDTWLGFPTTSFTWADPKDYHGLMPSYTVRFVGQEIALLDVRYDTPAGYLLRSPLWQVLPILALALVLMVLGFYQRRQVDLAARWRTVTTALAFLLGIWQSWRLPHSSGSIFPDPTLVSFFSALFGLAVAFFWFFMSIVLERAVRRVAPAKFAGFVRVFDRRILSEPCGLALLRGIFFGLALLGVDTLLVSTGTNNFGMRLDILTHLMTQAWPYLGSSWTNAHLTLDSLFQGLAIGAFIGFVASFLAGFVRRTWVVVFVAGAFAAVILVHPMLSLGSVQPYPWRVLLLLFDCLLLVWVFMRFDLLTLMATGFTFSFWWLNYRLLVMFEPTGSGEQWLAFAVWGLFVLAAAAIAFQSSLRSARRRLAAAFE